MGDRISISFTDGQRVSVTLFSHTDGKALIKTAKKYLKELRKEKLDSTYPLGRFEPNTVMVDFIRYITKDKERILKNYYLGKSYFDGDDHDNGHYMLNKNTR